jgi:pullulanase/glycogen debranching enzyme
MYEAFGAVVTGSSVEFRLFFPDKDKDASQYDRGGLPGIKKVQVCGNFQSHNGARDWTAASAPVMTLNDHPKGILYTLRVDDLPDGFFQYKYIATFDNGTTRWCTDPCTRYIATTDENAGFVVGGHDIDLQPLANRLPLADLVIYELNIDDFTTNYRGNRAPIDAIHDKIPYLLDLGVNAIEFMPWTAWRGGQFNWGYDPYLFFSVEDRYLNDPTDPLVRLYRLKRLIDELHRNGIHVIMDGVFNQVSKGDENGKGFPYWWLYQDPADSPFIGRPFAGMGFDDDLDYYNGCVQTFITDVCNYWLDEYKIDGIRFDYTLGYYIPGDMTQGIPQLIADLKNHVSPQMNHTFTLEHLPDDRYAAIDATNTICATGCWYDRFLFDMPRYAASGVDTKVMRLLNTQKDFAAGKGPVVYLDNHDHSTVANRVGGRDVWWKLQPALVALLTSGGAVLLRNGQEFGEDNFVPDGGDDREKPRPLQWDLLNDPTGQSLYGLHKKLIALRKECPALRTGSFTPAVYDEQWTQFDRYGYGVDIGRGIIIYVREGKASDGQTERFVIVLNFSDSTQQVNVPFPVDGVWMNRLGGGYVQVSGGRLANLQVTSHWAKVFYRKG